MINVSVKGDLPRRLPKVQRYLEVFYRNPLVSAPESFEDIVQMGKDILEQESPSSERNQTRSPDGSDAEGANYAKFGTSLSQGWWGKMQAGYKNLALSFYNKLERFARGSVVLQSLDKGSREHSYFWMPNRARAKKVWWPEQRRFTFLHWGQEVHLGARAPLNFIERSENRIAREVLPLMINRMYQKVEEEFGRL